MVNDKNKIPGMELNDTKKYSNSQTSTSPENNPNGSVSQGNSQQNEEQKKENERIKKIMEKLKSTILEKYSFIQSISILPPQSIKVFIDEEEVPKETEKHHHLNIVVPDKKEKKLPEIKKDIVKEIEKTKEYIWLHLRTPQEIWGICLDSKFEIFSAIAMSYPLYDKGILGAMRVTEIHKSMVLQKFDKYVVSYVLGGSMIRGEAKKTSDIDVFLIINDTDVKRMPRLELKERLRGMIYQYVSEAMGMAGVKMQLEPQIYLLTDFWEAMKDAHPVMFTFIRDGVPIYDRGTFMPWKSLLNMGKLKPSPEAIDMFMSMGDNTRKRIERAQLDLVVGDIYWGTITPSQALLMLYGVAPPSPKQVVPEMKKIFVEKEKMLEKKYIDILEKIVIKYYKGYEHGKVKKVSGKEVDMLLEEMEEYNKRMKELRKQIEKRTDERTIEQFYKDVFELLKSILGNKAKEKIVEEFNKKMVKTGKFSPQHLRILKNIVKAREEFKKGKLDTHRVHQARRESRTLINDLIEYSQRCELMPLEKGRFYLKYKEKGKEKNAELLSYNGKAFLLKQNEIKKITNKIEESNLEEINKEAEKQKSKKEIELKPEVFKLIKKELGNYEIVL